MGFQRLAGAYSVTTGASHAKAVLLLLAWHACDSCGLAWPGRKSIAERTEVGDRSVTAALALLVRDAHLTIFRFPYGGRGLSTEYVVLPSIGELSTAPCGECAKRMKNLAPDARISGNIAPGARFNRQDKYKPRKTGAGNLAPRAHQQSVQQQQSGLASLAESETPAPMNPAPGVPATSDHPTGWEIPAASKDALESLFGSDPNPEPVQGPPSGKAQG